MPTPIEEMPYTISELICVSCGHRWIAARPERTKLKDIECAGCHHQGKVIETGQVIERPAFPHNRHGPTVDFFDIKCNFIHCIGGMGVAGMGSCHTGGDPSLPNCPNFKADS